MYVNYMADIGQYMDNETYPVLPSVKASNLIPNNNYLKKAKDITPDMLFSPEKRNEFMSYFPDIVKQLEKKGAAIDGIEHGKHLTKLVEYVVDGGKNYAGIQVAETYKMLLPKTKQTPENIKLGYYLGWCLELLIDSIIVLDDMLDGEKIRRKKPCWYLLEDVKLSACNDACILESAMYYLLRENFGHLDCYIDLVQYMQESSLLLYMGQHLEMKYSKDVFQTSLELYKATTKTASTCIVSYLPVMLGMTLAGYKNMEDIKKAQGILSQLGYFYLVENDYLECFGDPNLSGKPGRDIQMGRCRWPIVAFVEVASPEQKELMKAHYGKDNEESVAIVKQLMEDVNIHQLYVDYMSELYHKLMKDIEENSYGDMKNVYLKLVETMSCSTECGGVY
uniref:Putative polyprenyl synthetase n=2 Tax=Nyssomyia neivai TaxID=330878 RepID=A0A1L8DZE3_9DIPT